MAPRDPTEPSPLSGVASSATGTSSTTKAPIAGAAKVGAKVSIDGLLSVNNELRTMLSLLERIRTELGHVNTAASGFASTGLGSSGTLPGGVGTGTSSPYLSKFKAMTAGFSAMPRVSQVALVGNYVLGGASTMTSVLTNRFNQQLAESTPISQANAYLASQYGVQTYGTMERARVAALGNFVTSRQQAAAAQATGLGYGQSMQQTQKFLSSVVAPMVMASGGTLTDNQAAQRAGTLLDPMVMRRAQMLGITMGRVGGQVQNPQNIALQYIHDYEKRNGFKFNAIDFQNMQSYGSSTRYAFKRMYMLSDDAIDMIVQSGLQNLQYQSVTGVKSDINFSDTNQIRNIVSPNTLGLKALKLQTAQARRNANYFANQEGAMVGATNTNISIEDALGKTETAFSGLIGVMGEFQKAIKATIAGLGMMGAGAMFFGGGGGGLLGGGGGGVAAAAEGAAATGGGIFGGGGFLGLGKGAGMQFAGITAGVGLGYAGYKMGQSGNAWGIGLGAGGGALAALSMGLGPVGIGVGALVGGGIATYSYLKGKHKKQVGSARNDAGMMSTAELIKRIGAGGHLLGDQGSPGPFVTGAMDIMQQRRAALVYQALNEAVSTGMFDKMSTRDAQLLQSVIDFFGSGDTASDNAFTSNAYKAQSFLDMIQKSKPSIYKKYFGNISNAFAFADPNTSADKALTEAKASTYNILHGSQTGDPITGKGPNGPTWDNLDSGFKQQLTALLKAGGGQVWLEEGWRSYDTQRTGFLSRYHEDPNGDVSWNGKKWSINPGVAAMAPPGHSWHERGMAADLQGPGVTNGWLTANVAKFGLRNFADGTGPHKEAWHVQPANIPGAPPDDGSGSSSSGSTSSSSGSTSSSTSSTTASSSGKTFLGGSPGGVFTPALANASVSFLTGNNLASMGGWGAASSTAVAATAAATTGGGGSVQTTYGGSGKLSADQIAQYAYNAGFRGKDLVSMVAIAMRESGGNPANYNGRGNDRSYGLWQINMIGDQGTRFAQQIGINDFNQLFDPATNARAAYSLYSQKGKYGGLYSWGGYKNMDPLTGTSPYMDAAAKAVSNLPNGGTGDPVFGNGGGSGVTIHNFHVHMTSGGSASYDAKQLVSAMRAAASGSSGEVAVRRSS